MLTELRGTGDYGALDHVSDDEARDAIEAAAAILQAGAGANLSVLC